MKLRPLILALAVLVPAAGLVWWLQTPPALPALADERVGQRLADPARIAAATRVRIIASGDKLELTRSAGDTWAVAETASTPSLPADAERLNRLANDLVTPKIERLVSSRPEKIATYELDATSVTFLDDAGQTLLALHLGKTPEGGGRILRYADEPRAYLARLNAVVDASAASWRNTALVSDLEAKDVASLSIGFSDTPGPVVLSRNAADQAWSSTASPAGHQVKASFLNTQLSNLRSLRYTEVVSRVEPQLVAARIFPRDVLLTTFSGRTVRLSFSRTPEPAAPSDVASNPEGTPPAPRRIFVELSDSAASPTLATASKTHGFEIAEWAYSSLPANSADLFEPIPSIPSSSPTSESSTATAPSDPISVTTEPADIESTLEP